MKAKDKLRWVTRLKLCWFILTKGTTEGLPLHRTKREEEQWNICRQRDKELEAASRPRTYPKFQGSCHYTDYFERDIKDRKFWDKHDKTSDTGGV